MKKVCMIGCGGIGGYHLSHLVQYKDIITLDGFCDLIPEKAENFVKKAGSGKAYVHYKDMFDEVQPDVVFICVPPSCHGEIEYETIRRGIHFFVEKPVTLSIPLAEDIRDKAQAAGLITAVGFQLRYGNLVDPIKAFLKEHEVIAITCTRIGGIPGMPWWWKKATSGGQVVEQTVHQFDTLRYLYGEPESVFTFASKGFIQKDDYDVEDVSSTVIKFKNGGIANITTGCFATTGEAADSKITFSARDCRADLRLGVDLRTYGVQEKGEKSEGGFVTGNDGTMMAKGGFTEIRQEGDVGLECDRTFLEAVVSGDPSKIRSPYAEAVKTLKFVMACNESMDTGKAVKITY